MLTPLNEIAGEARRLHFVNLGVLDGRVFYVLHLRGDVTAATGPLLDRAEP
jgi:hypothetical protein